MKKNIVVLTFFLALALFSVSSTAFGQRSQSKDILERKIVIWKSDLKSLEKDRLMSQYGQKVKDLNLVRASVLEVKAGDIEALKKSPLVLRIDDDPIATVALKEINEVREERKTAAALRAAASSQVLPWGIDRIDAEKLWPFSINGKAVKIGIIDTGISMSHPDLTGNIKGGVNTISLFRNANDDNGHGSHVAGIIAAVNNSQGVVGGAPAASLYAIKVLNAQGSGYYSDIIEGLQWAIANNIDIVNMSLGGATDYGPLHDAVIAAKDAGIVIVAAAGNNGGAVIFPAAYEEVIAVSALDSSNNVASWSSRGAEVDLAAPGVSIYSTYKGKSYATLSGTSMAAPHVSAAVALLLNTAPALYDANSNGSWDPSEIQTKLEDKAFDLGAVGFDNLFGFGLVNALSATE